MLTLGIEWLHALVNFLADVAPRIREMQDLLEHCQAEEALGFQTVSHDVALQ